MSNKNSIGIEVVGNYDKGTRQWDAVTPQQIESVAQAIFVIAQEYGVPQENILPHEDVSAKTAGEGGVVLKAVRKRLDELWKKKDEKK